MTSLSPQCRCSTWNSLAAVTAERLPRGSGPVGTSDSRPLSGCRRRADRMGGGVISARIGAVGASGVVAEWARSSRSPIRRAGSARPRLSSAWRLPSPSTDVGSSSSISIPRATPPAGSASTGRRSRRSVYDILLDDRPVADVIRRTRHRGSGHRARRIGTWPAPRSSSSRRQAASADSVRPCRRSSATTTSSFSTARLLLVCSPSTR